MSFRDLNISTCYESNEQKTQLLDNFYIPVLEQSVKYYRIAGYFSSSALSVVAEGIEGLIKGNTAQLTKYCHQKRETQRSS